MNFLIDFLLTIFVIVSFLLVVVVLMQRPRSEGLGTAFASDTISSTFGGAASSVLVRFTTWMGGIFFFLTVLLAYLYSHRYSNQSVFGQDLRQTPVEKRLATPSPIASKPDSKAVAPVAEPNVAAPAMAAGLEPQPTAPVAAPAAPTPVTASAPILAPPAAAVPTPVPTATPPGAISEPVIMPAPEATPTATATPMAAPVPSVPPAAVEPAATPTTSAVSAPTPAGNTPPPPVEPVATPTTGALSAPTPADGPGPERFTRRGRAARHADYRCSFRADPASRSEPERLTRRG